jgi:hypothetical protein
MFRPFSAIFRLSRRWCAYLINILPTSTLYYNHSFLWEISHYFLTAGPSRSRGRLLSFFCFCFSSLCSSCLFVPLSCVWCVAFVSARSVSVLFGFFPVCVGLVVWVLCLLLPQRSFLPWTPRHHRTSTHRTVILLLPVLTVINRWQLRTPRYGILGLPHLTLPTVTGHT